MDIQGSFSVLTCSPLQGHKNTYPIVFLGLLFFAKASAPFHTDQKHYALRNTCVVYSDQDFHPETVNNAIYRTLIFSTREASNDSVR